ncbi:MAG: hypothetical protein JST48_00660 [Bacteroidetes bacterium]|nr:hypothetical protein [Bacteroidota bacterium]
MSIKLFLNSGLTICLMACISVAKAQGNCKEVKATIQVIQSDETYGKGSVKIDFKGQSRQGIAVSLVGSKGYFKKDILEDEIKELNKGAYTLVFNSKTEEDNFCIKHFEFTIK